MFDWETIEEMPEEDRDIIFQISDRAAKAGLDRFDVESFAMDVAGVHLSGSPLRLKELLDAGDFAFMSEVYGIYFCVNRKIYQLEKGFLPVFAIH